MSNTAMLTNRRSSVINCRARAYDYLVQLAGTRPQRLTWDSTHCLQGHVQLAGRELVVIATRDASQRPVVLTEPGWDAVRRSGNDQRHDLIEACAITDRSSLVAAMQ